MTPMMRQYYDVKERNPGCILFFRLGDFYEMFGEDAKTASKALDLALTTRDKTSDIDERIPMCGIPYHSAESYIARLIAKGHKVAICEQLQDPATTKGLVDRDVVRLITPGTLMEASMLDEGKANYICSVYLGEAGSAACFADLSTGEISVTDFERGDIRQIKNELTSYSPSEALLLGDCDGLKHIEEFLKSQLGCLTQTINDEDLQNVTKLTVSTVTFTSAAECAVNALTAYLNDTQKTDLGYLRELRHNNETACMEMDINTIRNLELVGSLRGSDKKGSLLGVLDKTKTPMGRRLIRSWVLRPLLSVLPIKRRQSAVAELVSSTVMRGELIDTLRKINDIERLIGRIAFGNANCRDLKALSGSISVLPQLTSQLKTMRSATLRECAAMDLLVDIAGQIDERIKNEPPFSVREAGFINDGVDPEIDRLRVLLSNSSSLLVDIESRERERTGKNLKVRHNSVFGYYIEITRRESDDVPPDYIRKQTLTNCERFITEELKGLETEIFSAKDNLAALEYKLFEELRQSVAAQAARIQNTAGRIAELDCYCSLAETAVQNNYCLPEVDVSDIINIKDGRHPVVEVMQEGSLFVPNDTLLDCNQNRSAIITGPNMAGKSTYMRQTALIVLMAQIGSFVPACSAVIGIVDRVFTRIGASDDISSGRSTFMVEMTEVADILTSATKKSLLILDEIGRGTSTYDGMSVARAVLEHCCDKRKLGAKTMFATHYHELATLESEIDGIKNYNISAKKRGDDIIFLRKIVPGSTDDSYGIEVAGLAGVPESVIKRAKAVLAALEDGSVGTTAPGQPSNITTTAQMSLLDIGSNEIAEILSKTDLNTLTPLEALSLLFELKKKL